MKKNLKNYTTSMNQVRIVSLIENELISIGATHIAKTYENGRLNGITFQIFEENIPFGFKLPANIVIVEKIMLEKIIKPHKGTADRVKDQASRTAWKLLLDLVQVHASMILIGRRSAIEVFLPYTYDIKTDQTFFERLQENKFKMLAAVNK